jgi:Eukaryotic-type carbonic anhydrase
MMSISSSTSTVRLLFFTVSTLMISHTGAQELYEGGGQLYLDRFTYGETTPRGDGFVDYAPPDWYLIDCPDGVIADCAAYIDKWEVGRGWNLTRNHCIHCPATPGNFDCGRHHQSPIELLREYGLEVGTHPNANECIDLHWMKYEDSYCTLDQLERADAFTIERHALRISQPIEVYEDVADDLDGVADGVRLLCRIPGRGSRFGRIDFSKGFSDWWHLSHIDVRVPSEHIQQGRRYDAEIQLYHFYSTVWHNEMATISVFMQAYENAPVYRYLDKVICQWRKREYDVRQQCNLDPITRMYPGCFPLKRRMRRRAQETTTSSQPKRSRFQNVAEVLIYNEQHRDQPGHVNVTVHLDENDSGPAEEKDWPSWIQEQSQKMNAEDEFYHEIKDKQFGGNHTDDLHETFRKLLEGDEVQWFNYWPMLGVRTEYYYRYEGSQTIPPCFGNWIPNSRRNTNHWRLMKDPIRIHRRQLQELKRLVAERIAPPDDPVNPCQPDTAAKVTTDPVSNVVTDVDTARPIMYTSASHFKTFCECKDWPSKWPEDRNWCKIVDINERFYEHPYNFQTEGF